MTSRSCLASSLLFLACDGAAHPTAVETGVAPAPNVTITPLTEGELPRPSEKCPDGFMEGEDKCIPEKEAMALLEQKSREAVEKMTESKGNPEVQVQAQQQVVEIQEKKVDRVKDEHDKIKKLIREKKKAGKIKPVDNPFFFDKQEDVPDKPEIEVPPEEPDIEQRPPESPRPE